MINRIFFYLLIVAFISVWFYWQMEQEYWNQETAKHIQIKEMVNLQNLRINR